MISRVVSLALCTTMDCGLHRWFAENAENESFIISQDWKLLAAPVQSIYCPKSIASLAEYAEHAEYPEYAKYAEYVIYAEYVKY